MTKEQNQVKLFMVKAGQATPEKPTTADLATRILRVRLLLEEVCELAEASGLEMLASDGIHVSLASVNKNVLIRANGKEPDLVEMADALTDIDYVNLGAAVAYGVDLAPFQDEVQRSNMSKFIDGHRREDGKWIKGPSYTPANLTPILEAQKNG